MQRIDKKVVIKYLKVLSIEMDLAESGVIREFLLKGEARKFLWDPSKFTDATLQLLLKDDLSINTTFSQIHLDRQYL